MKKNSDQKSTFKTSDRLLSYLICHKTNEEAICRTCGSILHCKGGSTKSLQKYLRTVHNIVLDETKVQSGKEWPIRTIKYEDKQKCKQHFKLICKTLNQTICLKIIQSSGYENQKFCPPSVSRCRRAVVSPPLLLLPPFQVLLGQRQQDPVRAVVLPQRLGLIRISRQILWRGGRCHVLLDDGWDLRVRCSSPGLFLSSAVSKITHCDSFNPQVL